MNHIQRLIFRPVVSSATARVDRRLRVEEALQVERIVGGHRLSVAGQHHGRTRA
jgi:hypothetical protein